MPSFLLRSFVKSCHSSLSWFLPLRNVLPTALLTVSATSSNQSLTNMSSLLKKKRLRNETVATTAKVYQYVLPVYELNRSGICTEK